MFLARQRELATLDRLFQSERFEFVVIYGRRRIGKTALINEFIRNKPAIYYMGVEGNAAQNLDLFSAAVLAQEPNSDGLSFATMRDALKSVFERARNESLILALDEYPYMARADESLSSVVQGLIDTYKDSCRLKLILCGSSVSFMEDEVLAYKSPLYGRKTAQIRLAPLDFLDAQLFLPSMVASDRAFVYGMVGGTPHYLRQINDSLSLETNIKATLLNPSAMLFDEPRNLLMQELRRLAAYNAVLGAVAQGAGRVKEISDKTQESPAAVAGYLRTLQEMELVEKEVPYGESASSRHSRYRIRDPLFGFWHRFVADNLSALMQGKEDTVYRRIEPQFAHYMGSIFEEICKQYLWRRLGDGFLPVDFQNLGRWWGTDPRTRAQAEIDIVGAENSESALVGECKWNVAPASAGILRSLMDKGGILPYKQKHFCLFSRAGFTPNCRSLATAAKNVSLISFQDILEGARI